MVDYLLCTILRKKLVNQKIICTYAIVNGIGGNEVDVFACHLRSGHTQSCGCYMDEQIRKTKNKKHELSHNRLYKKFYSIVGRCHNPKDKAYHNYGARGY